MELIYSIHVKPVPPIAFEKEIQCNICLTMFCGCLDNFRQIDG